jgi:hypothetical protein
MKSKSPISKSLPLDIVGSTKFGRYPKISIEQTYNMIISDGFMVPFAGHELVSLIAPNGQGRGIYSSTRFEHMILVIDNGVYTVNTNLSVSKIATIDTFDGDVFIDENNAGQIAICDKSNIYIFNYVANTFAKASIDFLPGYICFQDGFFIAPDQLTAQWRLSDPNNGLNWPDDAPNVGEFQTKPDRLVATLRFPGKGNLLMVFGKTVTEQWYDTGSQLFPYQKNTFANIDYGCLNAATIASNDDMVVWLGSNEKSGPVIMYTTGGNAQRVSNDGIDFKFAQLNNPTNAYGFLYKQDGHILYQITFPDPRDNLTYLFDFTTQKIFTLSDEYMNFHIAKKIVFFNNSYYFVSFSDGNLYEINTRFTTYNGAEIPRIRVCAPIRLPDQSRFVINNVTFTIEQGDSSNVQSVDFSMAKDGGQSVGSSNRKNLNRLGHRPNRLNWWSLGSANDLTCQFRFWGEGRFVCSNGLVSIYQ